MQHVRSGERRPSLPSTVPEIQHQVSHELDIAVLDINGGAETAHVLGHVVAEDNAAHGRLAGAALAHEQHLALLLPLRCVHAAGYGRSFFALSIPLITSMRLVPLDGTRRRA